MSFSVAHRKVVLFIPYFVVLGGYHSQMEAAGPEDLALPSQAVSSVTQPAVNRSGTYLWAGPPGWEALGLRTIKEVSRQKLLDLAVDLM